MIEKLLGMLTRTTGQTNTCPRLRPLRFSLVALLALVFMLADPSQVLAKDPEVLTAGKLARDCSVATGASHLFCLGYIRGVVESQALRSQADRAFCPPALDPATRRQTFRQWYDRNREAARQRPAAEAVIAAFRARYPCAE